MAMCILGLDSFFNEVKNLCCFVQIKVGQPRNLAARFMRYMVGTKNSRAVNEAKADRWCNMTKVGCVPIAELKILKINVRSSPYFSHSRYDAS